MRWFQQFEPWEPHRFAPWGGLLHFSSYDVALFVMPLFPKGFFMKRDAGTSRLLGHISFVENKQRSVDCMFTPNLKVVAETRNKGCITTHAIGMAFIIQPSLLRGSWKLLHSQVKWSIIMLRWLYLASSRLRNDGAKIDKFLEITSKSMKKNTSDCFLSLLCVLLPMFYIISCQPFLYIMP